MSHVEDIEKTLRGVELEQPLLVEAGYTLRDRKRPVGDPHARRISGSNLEIKKEIKKRDTAQGQR